MRRWVRFRTENVDTVSVYCKAVTCFSLWWMDIYPRPSSSYAPDYLHGAGLHVELVVEWTRLDCVGLGGAQDGVAVGRWTRGVTGQCPPRASPAGHHLDARTQLVETPCWQRRAPAERRLQSAGPQRPPSTSPCSTNHRPRLQAPSRTRHRADSVEHLLNVACSLPALDDHLRRHLVQLITDHGCRRLSTTTVVVWFSVPPADINSRPSRPSACFSSATKVRLTGASAASRTLGNIPPLTILQGPGRQADESFFDTLLSRKTIVRVCLDHVIRQQRLNIGRFPYGFTPR